MADKDKMYRSNRKGLSPIMAAFTANEKILQKFLRRFTSNFDEIEDITQETILRALNAEKNIEIREPKAFIFGIARNVVRKELDRKSKSILEFTEGFAPNIELGDIGSEVKKIESRERFLLFSEAVTTLPEQCQRVFVLKKVYGYTHQEISNKLGISISTTEKHVATGLKRCRKYMENRMKTDQKNSVPFGRHTNNS